MCSATQPTGDGVPDPAMHGLRRRRSASSSSTGSKPSTESEEVSTRARARAPSLDNSSLQKKSAHDKLESTDSPTIDSIAFTPSPPDSPGRASLPGQFEASKDKESMRQKLLKMVSGVHRRGASSKMGSLGTVNANSAFSLDHHHSNYTGSQSMPTTPLQTNRLYSAESTSLHLAHTYHNHQQEAVVSVPINLCQYKLGGSLNPCSLERLGIVPNRMDLRVHSVSLTNLRRRSWNKERKRQDSSVIIKGIIPASPAALTGMLEPGDQLVAVGGHEVSLANVEEVLSEMTEELILDVIKIESPLTTPITNHSLSSSSIGLPMGEPNLGELNLSPTLPASHLALYLTLDTREDDEPCKDILFQYPMLEGEKSGISARLQQLRGVFLTLNDLLASISISQDSCCSIEVEDELFHVSCRQYGRELLVIALPAACVSVFVVRQIIDTVELTLNMLCGSISSAFTSHGNHQLVSHFLSSILLYHLTDPSPHAALHPALHTMSLPASLALRITSRMNQLDASDCSSHLSVLLTRRSYIPLGSCLFHWGCLVCSHLPPSLLRPVAQLAHTHQLLTLTASQPLTHTTIWQEVYLTGKRCEEEGEECVYQESYGRSFVLMIAMEHSLLCQVMEAQQGVGLSPPPDPYCIEQCRAILTDLHTSGILTAIDGRVLQSSPSPCLISADILLAAHISRTAHHQHSFSSSSSKKKYPSSSSLQSLQLVGSVHYDTDDERDTPPPASLAHRSRFQRLSLQLRRSHSSLLPESMTTPTSHCLHTRPPYTLTAGPDNLLLHYVLLDNGRGVLLTPFSGQVSSQPVHQRLLTSFRHVAADIHVVLQQKWEEEEVAEAKGDYANTSSESSSQFCFHGNSPVVEHGVLLECSVVRSAGSGLQAPPKLNYWVVGRLFPKRNQELFVCFQETSSQMCAEMAFKLLFGSMW